MLRSSIVGAALVLSALAAACAASSSGAPELPAEDDTTPPGEGEPIRPEPPDEPAFDAAKPYIDAASPDPVTLTKGQDRPRGVAVDETHVYFATTGTSDSSIRRVPKGGGADERVDQGASPGGGWVHAVDDEYVYFSVPSETNGTLSRVRKTGGAVEVMLTNVNVWAAVADATNLYFPARPRTGESTGSIRRVAKKCAVPCTAAVMASGQELPLGIALAGSDVYWTNMANDKTYAYPGGPVIKTDYRGAVRRAATSASNQSPTAGTVLAELRDPWGIAVTSGNVYYTSMLDSNLYRATVAGAGAAIASSGAKTTWQVVADANNVYFATGTSGEDGWSIMQLPTGAGARKELAFSEGQPLGLALDTDSVYWANYKSGEIRRQKKR